MSELLRALVARCDQLGLDLGGIVALGFDLVVLTALAGGVVLRIERAGGPFDAPRRLLASGLVVLATVVGTATVLGAGGMLGAGSLVASHVALLGLFALAERSRGALAGWREPVAWLRLPIAAALVPLAGLRSRAGWRRDRLAESLVVAALLAVLGSYLVLALLTPPLNWDSNTYRLNRVAHWLQEGSIHHYPTMEERESWVGQNADLVMLWLTSFFRREFPLVKLAQYGGGLLACIAVYRLAAWLGMARPWRYGAALTLAATPTVATQFVSAQTDLFAAGCLAAGLAFVPDALRTGRTADWALLGLGTGLAVGAKVTVLYWAPGLAVLLLGWALVERTPLRRLIRGSLVAAAVALPLCGFNFLLNSIEFGSPFAPRRAFRMAVNPERAVQGRLFGSNLGGIVWQLFEPHSNPLLPDALVEPAFDRLLRWLATQRPYYRRLLEALPAQGGWRSRGLNEDEASFGVLVPAAALAAGLLALLGAVRAGRVEARRVAVSFAAVVLFAVVFSWLSIWGVNEFRYFCLVAPLTALVAVALFGRSRSRLVGAAGALFLGAQLATALVVAGESRNQGWRVLRDPAAARWHGLWQETRSLIAPLGDRPLDVGLALYGDQWRAPLRRSPVAHRWHPVEASALADVRSLRELLDFGRLDALLVDPAMLPLRAEPGVGLRLLGTWTTRRALCRRLAPGERGAPSAFAVDGVEPNGDLSRHARVRLVDWRSGTFELRLRNASRLDREVELRASRQRTRHSVPARSSATVAVEVGEQDRVVLRFVEPPASSAGDAPSLRLEPSGAIFGAGLWPDGWTDEAVELTLQNWLAGPFALEVHNPAPLARTVRATSSIATSTSTLAPGASGRIEVVATPQDRVRIEISPPFVPRDWGRGDDVRPLGLFLRAPRDHPSG